MTSIMYWYNTNVYFSLLKSQTMLDNLPTFSKSYKRFYFTYNEICLGNKDSMSNENIPVLYVVFIRSVMI